MKKKDLLKTLKEYNFNPGKYLGQNFLIDENLLKFIVKTANPSENENILEIGPGFGALTRLLIESNANVTAIEYDRRVCDYLTKNISNSNFKLVEGDACRVNLDEIMGKTPFRSIANLPYSASTPFLGRVLEMNNPPKEMVFMLQKEMGMRISSSMGTKNYGSLSIRAQMLYDIKLVRKVPPQVFYPPPKVDSAILHFKLKDKQFDRNELTAINKVVRLAFAQRRKKMITAVSQHYDKDLILSALKDINKDENIRAERLSVAEFAHFALKISNKE